MEYEAFRRLIVATDEVSESTDRRLRTIYQDIGDKVKPDDLKIYAAIFDAGFAAGMDHMIDAVRRTAGSNIQPKHTS